MAVAIEEEDRVEIVNKLNEAIKTIGVRNSPVDVSRSEGLKTLLSAVLSRFETVADRVKREQA